MTKGKELPEYGERFDDKKMLWAEYLPPNTTREEIVVTSKFERCYIERTELPTIYARNNFESPQRKSETRRITIGI